MKKLLLVLILLLTVSITALAEGGLERTETRVVRQVEDYGTTIQCYVQVKNTLSTPASLDKATLTLYDKADQQIVTESTYMLFPSMLQPGETGYIHFYLFDTSEEMASVAAYEIEILTETEPYYEVQHVTHTVAYEEVPIYEGAVQPQITFLITNDTQEVLKEVKFCYVLRAEDGAILSIDYSELYNAGIPAGNAVYTYFHLDDEDYEAWTSKGYKAATVESFVFIEK